MQDINEGFAQLSEQLMLVAGMAYAVAFCAYVWDLFTFSKAAKMGLAGQEAAARPACLPASALAEQQARALKADRRIAVCAPAARPILDLTE